MQISKTLGTKDFPNFQSAVDAVRALAKGDKTIIPLGTMWGRADSLSVRGSNFDDEPTFALVGQFEATPNDPEAECVQSQAAFLQPRHVHDAIAVAIMGPENAAKKIKQPPKGKKFALDGIASIPFAVEIGLRKTDSDGGVGYEYIGNLVSNELQATDPLADLRAQFKIEQGKPVKALAAPKGVAAKALPAPKKKAKK